MSKQQLKGITWAHTRGFAPLAATACTYMDFHPDVDIKWEIRSLWAFGEGPLDTLMKEYDMLVIDHPFMGSVAADGIFLPLDEHLDQALLTQLENESMGASYASYNYRQHQWALPIDAAAMVSVSRPDLFEKDSLQVPETWDEVIHFADSQGKIAVPFTPMGLLGAFFTLCASQGESPFSQADQVVSPAMSNHVLQQLEVLYRAAGPQCLEVYPPAIFARMTQTNEIYYVPMIYGYSNYSVKGFAPTLLTFNNIPAAQKGGLPHGATLGGTGIALSSTSVNRDIALDYMAWIAGADCQSSLYTLSGGQPANKLAWEDDLLNTVTHNFFKNTAATIQNAFVRPRYNGFHGFQSKAGRLLQGFLSDQRSIADTMQEINMAYVLSQHATADKAL